MKVRSTRLKGGKKVIVSLVLENIGKCRVMDFSLTGIKFTSKQKLTGTEEVTVSINDDIVYSGQLQIVWSNESESNFINGAKFLTNLIMPGTVESYRIADEFIEDLDKDISPLISLPKEAKSIIFDLQNALIALKRISNKYDEILKSKPTKIGRAFDLSIRNMYLKYFHPFVLKLSKDLTAYYNSIDNDEDHYNLQQALNLTVQEHIVTGKFSKRALEKPLGYAGDYELMSQLYDETLVGNSLFEKIIQCYAVNEFSSTSVRFRRDYISNKLVEKVKNCKSFKILSVACGPAVEIVDLINKMKINDSGQCVEVFLLDADIDALIEAKNRIDSVAVGVDLSNIKIHYIHESITAILNRKIIKKEYFSYGEFDFVYSMGLYDYLEERVAKALTNELVKYTKNSGEIIIGNFHESNPTKAVLDLILNWKLIHRTEEKMLAIVERHESIEKRIIFDENKIEMLMELSL